MKKSVLVSFLLLLFLLASCATISLTPANFAWPVERVLTVDNKGMAKDDRYMISFNARPLLFEETGDSTSTRSIDLRVIRDAQGYYYITARGFRHVYVFEQGEGMLSLKTSILISEQGMRDPAFNQRQSFIQLLNGSEKPRSLTPAGLVEGGL